MKFFLMLVVLFSLPTTAQVYVTPAPCVRGLLPPSPRPESVYVQQHPVVHTTRVVVQRPVYTGTWITNTHHVVYTNPRPGPMTTRKECVGRQPYVRGGTVFSIGGQFSIGTSGGYRHGPPPRCGYR